VLPVAGQWGGKGMSGAKRLLLLASGIALVVGLVTDAEAQRGYVPAFQDGPWLWEHPFGGQFPAVNGSALPVSQDPGHPLIPGRTWHIPDLSNPNLKPWARDVLKKEAEEIEKGKLQLSASSSCFLTGVPDFFSDGGPYLIVQAPDKVLMIDEAGPIVRHIYLNVPHSKNPKPSWTGESIGWYEGETLVVDTIGMNTRTAVDHFNTPHTEKLHVTERWRVLERGLTMRVDITVDDPDTFYQSWKTYQVYRRTNRPLEVELCNENNSNLFDYKMPVAKDADF
jgi:hypothetical protein